ncbi:MAG TPA: type I methionyl aminopeptidase [Candidatus Saccharimonadales bacterium]|nr:type I methionyl aminopeptidase [Candidatus Saccharimonadales bacterium]
MADNKLVALQAAGQVAAQIHQEVAAMIKPGLNLLEIEALANKRINEAGMKPAFPTNKFPATCCLSVNEEIVHGLPHDFELAEGDVLKVDLGVMSDGWMVDTARTHGVGQISNDAKRLLTVTEAALEAAIKVCRAGNHVGDIGAIVEQTVKAGGCAVIRDLSGHGVGRTLQEEPTIPNFGRPGTGPILKEGMVLAIEPITCLKATKIAVLSDGWTIIAQNGLATAQFEHTILVTDNEPLILTKDRTAN